MQYYTFGGLNGRCLIWETVHVQTYSSVLCRMVAFCASSDMLLHSSSGLKMYFGFTSFEVLLQCSWSRISQFRYCCCAIVWSVYMECVLETAAWSGWEKSFRQVASKHSYTCVCQPVTFVACGRGTLYAVWKQPLWICMSCPDGVQCKVRINGSVVLTVSAINCILPENVILWWALCSDHVLGIWHDGGSCLLPATRGPWLRCWRCMEYVTMLHSCRLIDVWHSGRPQGRPADSSVVFVDGLIQEKWCVTMCQIAARADMLTVVWC